MSARSQSRQATAMEMPAAITAKVLVDNSGGRRRVSLQLSGTPALMPSKCPSSVHPGPNAMTHSAPRCFSRRFTIHPQTPPSGMHLQQRKMSMSLDCKRRNSGLVEWRRGLTVVLTPDQLRGETRRRSSVVLTPVEQLLREHRRRSSILTPQEQLTRESRRRSSVVLTPAEQSLRESRRRSSVFTPVLYLTGERGRKSSVFSSPVDQFCGKSRRKSSIILTPDGQFNVDFRRKLSVVWTPIEQLRKEGRRHSILTPIDLFRRRTSNLGLKHYQSPELLMYDKNKARGTSKERDGTHTTRESLNMAKKQSVTFLPESKEPSATLDTSNIRRNTIAFSQTARESNRAGEQLRNEPSNNGALKSCIQSNRKLLDDQEVNAQSVQTPPTNCLPCSPLDNSVFRIHTLSRAHCTNIDSDKVETVGSSAFKSPPNIVPSRLKNVESFASSKDFEKRDSVFSLSECSTKNAQDTSMKNADQLDGRFHRRKSVAFKVRKSLTPSEQHRRSSLPRHKPRYSLSSFLADYHAKLSQQEVITPLFSIHHNTHFPQISLGRVLGAGGFGSVYQGTYQNKLVAVKRMHSITKNQRARVASYKAELNAMRLRHPNIVQVLTSGCTQSLHGDAYIVMEYAGDRNLAGVLDDPTEAIDLTRRLRFSNDIATALRFIHANCIIHLDLKPANVIITPNGRCKLGDFGCCQVIEEGTGRVTPTQRSELTGTFAYQAPEVLRGQAPSTKADIYSLGITLWQLVTRTQPYYRQNQHVVIFGVVAHHLRPALPPSQGAREEEYCRLMVQCWQPLPQDRPQATVIVDTLRSWLMGGWRKGSERKGSERKGSERRGSERRGSRRCSRRG